ncbi:tetratricopeptide repeat protein [Porphyromonas gulae]|uniref:tetratricopeptide repeat protein n=1 Tax=Porphyromonas gulae TaxID=111105 RepID=UPI00052E3933|nr:tetratricopeptide repeat protein [Porphyromonas gulae]KGN88063.1 tetratricopeptide repeat protein [Porphyromonas gulae]
MTFKRSLFLLLLLLSVATARAQIDVDRVITIGRNALYFNDYVVSIGYFNQVVGLRPWMAEPYFYRGIAKISLEDYTGAEADASACLQRNALIPKAYLLRGVARQNLGKIDSAIQDYRRGLELMPNDEGMLVNLTGVLTDSKRYAEAREGVAELLRFYPKSKQAHIALSAIELGEQDTVAAIRELNEVLRMDSLFAPAYSQMAMLHLKSKRNAEAMAALDKAIELEPSELSNYINRGVIRYQSNDLRGAMDDYSHVVRQKPNDKLARFNRALLRSYLGDVNNAIEDFDVVIRLEPENYHALYNRAILLAQINENRKAIADFDKVLGHYPDFVVGYYARSQAKKALGDTRGAERDYWRAFDIEKAAQNKTKNTKKSSSSTSAKETREDSDETIEKFNLLVVSEKSSEKRTRYSSRIRGRIQDNDVEVQPSPLFVLSYYEQSSSEEVPRIYYSEAITRFNDKKVLPKRLKPINREVALSQEQVAYHEQDITEISERTAGNADMCFRRALDYMLIQNLEQAIADFDQAVELNKQFALAYFGRAIARAKLIEARQGASFIHQEAETVNVTTKALITTPRTNAMGVPVAADAPERKPAISDVDGELVMRDLNRTIELDPNFAYAYYNRAVLLARRGDTDAALSDYDRAIKAYPEFADAYFNRGLLLLSRGKAKEGIADLSRAGEYGLYKAYNIIKRMSAKS